MALKDYGLTTVSRFKDYASVSTSADDTLIENLINIVTEFVENYTQRRFKQTTYTDEEYDGKGSRELVLRQYPITTFTRLQRRDTLANTSNWSTIDSELYFADLPSGIIEARFDFFKHVKLYRVTYIAGYNFDNSSTFLSDTEAGDVEWATWELVKAAYNKRRQQPGLSSARLGDASVTYRAMVIEDQDIKAILDKYRRQSVQ